MKKRLRNEDGTGMRVGLTRVSDMVGYDIVEGKKTSVPGELYLRRLCVNGSVEGEEGSRFGYEETYFLLLSGYLPNKQELRSFYDAISSMYELLHEFLETRLMRMPPRNPMDCIQQSVPSLYDYDDNPDNADLYHIVLKGLDVLAKLPSIIYHGHHSKMCHYNKSNLFIHYARKEYSIAENILYMLREDRKFTPKEAELLDTLLVLRADHGGGNSSAFTNVVISFVTTDSYPTTVGSISSLKESKYDGANIRCTEMMEAVIKEIGISADEKAIRGVSKKILGKDFYDSSGPIYGLDHAIYIEPDPRTEILRQCCKDLAKGKKREGEFAFMARLEITVRDYFQEVTGRKVFNNVDFYNGFTYDMLNILSDLYTPLFTCGRTIGWLAYNIEGKLYDGRIMRPVTKYVGELQEYKETAER